jgi:cation/acetate symporter
MICGIAFTSSYIVYFQFLGGTKEQLFLGITPEGIGFVGMLINFIVAFAVSSITKSPPEHIAEMVADIRTPGRASKAPPSDFEI